MENVVTSSRPQNPVVSSRPQNPVVSQNTTTATNEENIKSSNKVIGGVLISVCIVIILGFVIYKIKNKK